VIGASRVQYPPQLLSSSGSAEWLKKSGPGASVAGIEGGARKVGGELCSPFHQDRQHVLIAAANPVPAR
jgi:hypothetical protein